MFNKKEKYKRVQVIFTNEHVKFTTEYLGNINYLLDELYFETDSRICKYNMRTHKIKGSVNFPALNDKYSFEPFMTIYYTFDYLNGDPDNMNLVKFQSLVNRYGFAVEDMSVIKEEDKEKE